jgi:hypothetical protein
MPSSLQLSDTTIACSRKDCRTLTTSREQCTVFQPPHNDLPRISTQASSLVPPTAQLEKTTTRATHMRDRSHITAAATSLRLSNHMHSTISVHLRNHSHTLHPTTNTHQRNNPRNHTRTCPNPTSSPCHQSSTTKPRASNTHPSNPTPRKHRHQQYQTPRAQVSTTATTQRKHHNNPCRPRNSNNHHYTIHRTPSKSSRRVIRHRSNKLHLRKYKQRPSSNTGSNRRNNLSNSRTARRGKLRRMRRVGMGLRVSRLRRRISCLCSRRLWMSR